MKRFEEVDFRLVYRNWDNFKHIGETLTWHDLSLEHGSWELVNYTHSTHECTNKVEETIPYTLPEIDDKVYFIRLGKVVTSTIKWTDGTEQHFGGYDDDDEWLTNRINDLVKIMEEKCT